MNKKSFIYLLFCTMAFVVFGTSCATKKIVRNTPVPEITTNQLIQKVDENKFEFDKIQAKINAKIETKDNSVNVKGHLRMEQDSIIWMSITLQVGTELFRAKITPDSVYLMDKNNDKYYIESIDLLSQFAPAIPSIDFLQSLLVGNDIFLENRENCNVQIDNYQYKTITYNELKKKNKNGQEEWTAVVKESWIDPELFRITKQKIRENFTNSEITYSDFSLINDKNIPTKIIINVSGEFNMKATINYSGVSTNDKIDFKFKIPKKYERAYFND